MLNQLLIAAASLSALRPDFRIIQAPVAIVATTGLLTGTASIAVKVPGTFSGMPPRDFANARFFSHIEFCNDTPVLGDYVDAISIEDTDGKIPAPARGPLPDYPTVVNFSSDTGVTVSNLTGYFTKDGCVTIGSMDGELQLIPSEFYLKATIHSGVSKTWRINLVWGRYVTGF